MAVAKALFGFHPLKPLNNGFKSNQRKTTFAKVEAFNVFTNIEKYSLKNENDHSLPEFEFKDYLSSKIKRVNEALDQTVPLQHPTQMHEAMRYSLLLPGKRFRPILCLASCALVGGDEAQAMPVACAIEMIHTMSLMLDDLPCMDDDDVRRGKPTCHKVFGEEMAILGGGSLLSLAFQHIAERRQNVSPNQVLRAIIELALGTGFDGLLGGQLLDLHCEGKEVSLVELEYIYLQKTARLIEASTVCGAIMGGGDDEKIERLRRYGRHVGVMCQVVDDIMGLTKSLEELGKTPKKDLESDKAIYPKLLGMEGAKRSVKELMGKAMEELSCFDPTKASPLFHLPNYIANGIN